MKKSLKQILFIGLLIFSTLLKAEKPYKPTYANPVLEPWRWTEFPGYDTIRITCLTKGPENGMWMGIGNRAVYYDGYQSKAFIQDSSAICALTYEKNRELLATTEKGLYRFEKDQFRQILDFPFTAQRNFVTDSNGDVWIGSDYGLIQIKNNQIFCLNPEGYFEINDDGTVKNTLRLENATDYRFTSVKEIRFPVYNLFLTSKGILWMVTDLAGKNMVSTVLKNTTDQQSKWKYFNIPSLAFWEVSGICVQNNSLYVTSNNVNVMLQRYLIGDDKWESIDLKNLGGDNVQESILKTPDGRLWMGGHSKLYELSDSGWKVYQYPDVALPLSYIHIFCDAQNQLYVFGTNGSLTKLDLSNKKVCTYQGLNFQCNTPDGRLWFTTNSGTVVTCDSARTNFQEYTTTDGLMSMAMSLHYSPRSGLWAAGSNNGQAAAARFSNNRWQVTTFQNLYLGFAYNGIYDLGDSAVAFPVNGVPDLDNSSYRGGFEEYNYKESRWKSFSKDKVPQRIPSIGQTSDGRLWFSGNVFTVFDGKKTTQVELPVKTLSWTDDIGVSPTDRIWVAQGGSGLFYFDGKKWIRFSTFNKLASNMVTSLLVENDSSVYVATDKGISFFDGHQFTSQIIHPDLTIQRERGFLRKSADDALWINQATREWYLYDFNRSAEDPTLFKTTMYKKEKHAPKTLISFSNREISSSGNIIIGYSAVDFWNQTPAGKIQFSHRLNQEEWSPFSEEKSSVFLDLDAGNYTLEVRARDLDGNIEPKPAQISFSILPPVYRRAWFILTIFAFLSIIVWLLVRLYARNRQIHELDQLKLRLFTDISHELKTPLTLIMLPLRKLLDRPQKQQENSENLELIYNNVQRLSNLVNQVVDFRRLEAGKIQLELSPGDLVKHLKSIAAYYKPLAHEKNIRLECSCNLQELWVKYDADKLEKIVVNLLSNAFKYTPENEWIKLIAQIDPPFERLELRVSDSGPGIPAEMQQNIFDRFYRLRNEKLNRIPGSGIGLSLVKELVNLHRGNIEVISDGIHGTSFQVTIPLIPAEKVEIQQLQPDKKPEMDSFQITEKASILLIEDEEPMLRFITNELKNYFNVSGATSVEKARELLEKDLPDLILSDVMLPGMSGTEFCSLLKSDPNTSHLPVILLTARDSEEDVMNGLGTGADDYITKPFRMNELIARCLNLIENRRRLSKRFADQEQPEAKSFTQNAADQEFLDRAINVVLENMENSEFDVPGFCQEMNCSKTLLYSKLKLLIGQSATEFVRNIRLKEARKLLLENKNQHTIAEISYMVGFNDPLYFSRCFRKYFGIPPSEIIRKD